MERRAEQAVPVAMRDDSTPKRKIANDLGIHNLLAGRITPSLGESPVRQPTKVETPQRPTMPEAHPSYSSSTDWNGNDSIKVGVRVRPLTARELSTPVRTRNVPHFRSKKSDPSDAYAWSIPDGDTIVQKGVRRVEGRSLFRFDSIFNETTGTHKVYEDMVRPIVNGVTTGQNGTVFCYGQTSSGKTFTMQGDSANNSAGIIQLVAGDLFRQIEHKSLERDYSVQVSYIEIYNEKVRDLLDRLDTDRDVSLNDSRSTRSSVNSRSSPVNLRTLAVREDPQRGGVYVNCKEKHVGDADALVDVLQTGNQNRAVASTSMNDRSSRSHTIFRISLESREKDKHDMRLQNGGRVVRISNLILVDLAGSENGHQSSSGSRQREGGKINQSLLSLSQVIQALSMPPEKRPAYINYRDSKLTRILQPYLSGNALMTILCCVTPSRLHVEETRSTLKFASRAKLVETKPLVNEMMDDAAMVKKLQHDLNKARRHLKRLEEREQAAEQNTAEAKEEVQKLKELIFGGGALPEFETPLPKSPSRTPHARNVTPAPAQKDNGLPLSWNEDATPGQNKYNFSARATHPQEAAVRPPKERSSPRGRWQGSPQRSTRALAPPSSEVFIMLEPAVKPSTVTVDEKDAPGGSQLQDAEQRVDFLKMKLDATEDLVESLFIDLESARKCIHTLVFKNGTLANEIERLTKQLQNMIEEGDSEASQRYLLVKYCMYGGLIFFVFGFHELYFATIMFLWLCLEVLT